MARLAISADSHILEARDVFLGLAEKFGDRAPRVVHEEGKGDYIDIPASGTRLNATIGGVGRLGIAGMSLDDPETHRLVALGLSHTQAVNVMYGVGSLSGLLAWVVVLVGPPAAWPVAGVVGVAGAGAIVWLERAPYEQQENTSI